MVAQWIAQTKTAPEGAVSAMERENWDSHYVHKSVNCGDLFRALSSGLETKRKPS